jgi:hypothetical protein
LSWISTRESVEFEVSDQNGRVPPDDWAGYSHVSMAGKRCHVGPLLRLLEDEVARVANGAVHVPHLEVARLSHVEARDLGLPPDAPFSLEVSTSDTITSPEARIDCRFWHPSGFPVSGVVRQGSILTVDDDNYRLFEPAYSFLKGISGFNEVDDDVQSRLEEWGKVSRHLPEDAVVDEYLRTQRVVFVTSFKMEPFANEKGEADFHVVPGWRDRAEYSDEIDVEPKFLFREGLPGARQDDFDRRFLSFRDSRQTYAVGGGWHVVLDGPVQRLLSVARAMHDASQDERRDFILRPHSYFRAALEREGQDGDEPDAERILADVFWDEGYSERVAGIGIWQPKVLPWLKSTGDSWLPGEDLGVRIGDQFVRIEPEKLQPLRDDLATALESGLSAVDFDGYQIPATREAVEALDQLIGRVSPSSAAVPPTDEPYPASDRLVLLVKENFENVDYERAHRPSRGAIGRLPGCVDPGRPLPHQLEAFQWLQHHWTQGSPGALLADDM